MFGFENQTSYAAKACAAKACSLPVLHMVTAALKYLEPDLDPNFGMLCRAAGLRFM